MTLKKSRGSAEIRVEPAAGICYNIKNTERSAVCI